MSLVWIVIGAACFGWLLPEFFAVMSTRNVRVPMGMNFIAMVGASSLAYGIAA